MKIIIVGAGQVGETVAVELHEEHEVIVIDRQARELEKLPYDMDVLQGEGNNLDCLREAGVMEAAMLISCTSDDRTNTLICSTVKIISSTFTIARVSDPSLLDTWKYSHNAFGVDLMVGRASLMARRITEAVGYSADWGAARAVDSFAGGRVELAEFNIQEESDIAHDTVRRADRYRGITFGMIFRNGDMILPRGNTEINPGDRLVVLGQHVDLETFAQAVTPRKQQTDLNDIVIFGGGDIGYETARFLEERNQPARIVEIDPDRAQRLAEDLPDSLILQDDALSGELWEQEQLYDADMLIVTMRPDERNFLVSQMAKRRGIPRVLSVVHEREYVDVFESVDIDITLHPREVVARQITGYVLESYAENITLLEHRECEAFELTLDASSPLVGSPLEDSLQSIRGEVVMGAVVRGGRSIPPRGDTVPQAGDRVVILASSDVAEDVAEQI